MICIGDTGEAAQAVENAVAVAVAIVSRGGGVMEEELLSLRIGSRSKN